MNGSTIDLGTLGGTFGIASALNNVNQVIGDAGTQDGAEYHAFIYSNGTILDIGTLGGTTSTATDINDVGMVVGSSFVSGNAAMHAFLYDGVSIIDLGTLGGTASGAAAINSLGNVVGDSYTAGNQEIHPFRYQNGVMDDLGTLGGWPAFATDINDSGVIVGESGTADMESHAFVVVDGTMLDLGTLGGTWSTPYEVNVNGVIAGDSSLEGDAEFHGFVYAGGVMTDLGTLGGTFSTVHGLNNNNQIVGDASDSTEMTYPFLWENGVMIDLNSVLPLDSGWELWSAQFINDSGQIVGFGLLDGNFAWFFLILESSNNAPEANAGQDQVHQCPGNITLNGSGSSDMDGDGLHFEWLENNVLIATGVSATVPLSEGTHSIVLRVTDSAGGADEDSILIRVIDTEAPIVSCPLPTIVDSNADCSAFVPDYESVLEVADNCTSQESLIIAQNPQAGTVLGLGQHEIEITVQDEAGNVVSCTAEVIVVDGVPPEIEECAETFSVVAGSNNKGAVPDMRNSVKGADNCTSSDFLAFSQQPNPDTMLDIGSYPVEIMVMDLSGNISTCLTSLEILDGTPPTLSCPGQMTAEANQEGWAEIPDLVGRVEVSDNWNSVDQIALAQRPEAGTLVRVGSYSIVVIARDETGNEAVCTTQFSVNEPVCIPKVGPVSATPHLISKANHDMVPVSISVRVAPGCDTPVRSEIMRVDSSEPVTGKGDNTSQDWEITGPLTVNLRAEQSPFGEGRTYTIIVQSTDHLGNISIDQAQVLVSKKQKMNGR